MTRFRYAREFSPPAPFVIVTLTCPQTSANIGTIPAQLDTAADRTVLPGRIVRGLGLLEDGRLLFQGFVGDVVELPIFLVQVQVHDLPAVVVRAVIGEHEPFILLGRDVLNVYRILLDGPQEALEVERPRPCP